MKLTVTRDAFWAGVDTAGRFVPDSKLSSLPAGILIQASGTELVLIANDDHKGVLQRVPAAVSEPGEFCVADQFFSDMVKSLPGGNMELHVVDGLLHVACDGIESRYEGLPAEEFPLLAEFSPVGEFELGQAELRGALRRVRTAASQNSERPTLCGIYFDLRAGSLYLAATDGYRMALDMIAGIQGTQDASFIVPDHVAGELWRALSDDPQARGRVRIDANTAEFHLGPCVIQSRLVAAQYPDYRRCLPPSFSRAVTVPREALVAALKRVRILATRDKQVPDRVQFDLVPGAEGVNGKLVLWCQVKDFGQHREELDAVLSGEPLSLAVRGAMSVSALEVTPGGHVTLELNEEMEPVVIRGSGREAYLSLVMPMDRA